MLHRLIIVDKYKPIVVDHGTAEIPAISLVTLAFFRRNALTRGLLAE